MLELKEFEIRINACKAKDFNILSITVNYGIDFGKI